MSGTPDPLAVSAAAAAFVDAMVAYAADPIVPDAAQPVVAASAAFVPVASTATTLAVAHACVEIVATAVQVAEAVDDCDTVAIGQSSAALTSLHDALTTGDGYVDVPAVAAREAADAAVADQLAAARAELVRLGTRVAETVESGKAGSSSSESSEVASENELTRAVDGDKSTASFHEELVAIFGDVEELRMLNFAALDGLVGAFNNAAASLAAGGHPADVVSTGTRRILNEIVGYINEFAAENPGLASIEAARVFVMIVGDTSAGKDKLLSSTIGFNLANSDKGQATAFPELVLVRHVPSLGPTGVRLSMIGYGQDASTTYDNEEDFLKVRRNLHAQFNQRDELAINALTIKVELGDPSTEPITFLNWPGLVSAAARGDAANVHKKHMNVALARMARNGNGILVIARNPDAPVPNQLWSDLDVLKTLPDADPPSLASDAPLPSLPVVLAVTCGDKLETETTDGNYEWGNFADVLWNACLADVGAAGRSVKCFLTAAWPGNQIAHFDRRHNAQAVMAANIDEIATNIAIHGDAAYVTSARCQAEEADFRARVGTDAFRSYVLSLAARKSSAPIRAILDAAATGLSALAKDTSETCSHLSARKTKIGVDLELWARIFAADIVDVLYFTGASDRLYDYYADVEPTTAFEDYTQLRATVAGTPRESALSIPPPRFRGEHTMENAPVIDRVMAGASDAFLVALLNTGDIMAARKLQTNPSNDASEAAASQTGGAGGASSSPAPPDHLDLGLVSPVTDILNASLSGAAGIDIAKAGPSMLKKKKKTSGRAGRGAMTGYQFAVMAKINGLQLHLTLAVKGYQLPFQSPKHMEGMAGVEFAAGGAARIEPSIRFVFRHLSEALQSVADFAIEHAIEIVLNGLEVALRASLTHAQLTTIRDNPDVLRLIRAMLERVWGDEMRHVMKLNADPVLKEKAALSLERISEYFNDPKQWRRSTGIFTPAKFTPAKAEAVVEAYKKVLSADRMSAADVEFVAACNSFIFRCELESAVDVIFSKVIRDTLSSFFIPSERKPSDSDLANFIFKQIAVTILGSNHILAAIRAANRTNPEDQLIEHLYDKVCAFVDAELANVTTDPDDHDHLRALFLLRMTGNDDDAESAVPSAYLNPPNVTERHTASLLGLQGLVQTWDADRVLLGKWYAQPLVVETAAICRREISAKFEDQANLRNARIAKVKRNAAVAARLHTTLLAAAASPIISLILQPSKLHNMVTAADHALRVIDHHAKRIASKWPTEWAAAA